MTARQQRRAQQKAERKAQKLERRRSSVAAEQPPAYEIPAPAASSRPCSERKLAANRANAKLSTGPVTITGRQTSSQNRTRHGLTGRAHSRIGGRCARFAAFRVLNGESQSDFDTLLESLMEDHAPTNQTEVEYVQQMAEALWLSKRSVRLQDHALVALESADEKERQTARKDLALFIRYQTTHDRAFIRYSTELRKLRNERRRVERGFESQKLRAAQETRKQELHEIRQAIEKRKQERHELSMQLAKAKAERRQARETVANPVQPVIPAVEKCVSAVA